MYATAFLPSIFLSASGICPVHSALCSRRVDLHPPSLPADHSLDHPTSGLPPWVPTPERYDSNLSQYRSFLIQCGLVFDQQPRTYSTDRSRIAYLIGLLRGEDLEWAIAAWEKQSLVTAHDNTDGLTDWSTNRWPGGPLPGSGLSDLPLNVPGDGANNTGTRNNIIRHFIRILLLTN